MTTLTLAPAPEPGKHDGYTTEPTRVRVIPYDRDADGRITDWLVDGVDDDGNYTEGSHVFDTREGAFAHVPEFIATAALDGVTWLWRTPSNALHEVA